MTTQNKTSEIEYCEVCGTMIVAGTCQRCNSAPKISKPGISKSRKINKIPKSEIHNLGVEYAINKLSKNGISTTINEDDKLIDLVDNNGKTIIVRSLLEEMRDPVITGSLDGLKSDYIILVTNLKYTAIKNIYIMKTEIVKSIAHLDLTKQDKTYFINVSEYRKYKNNYGVLTE